jgi:hypothetical protein
MNYKDTEPSLKNECLMVGKGGLPPRVECLFNPGGGEPTFLTWSLS